jgi:hypothetical protein
MNNEAEMSKITTRKISHINDIFSDSVLRCAALVKQVALPQSKLSSPASIEPHEYAQEFYVVAEVEALNIGPIRHQYSRVDVVIDSDSELECNGVYKSLLKAKEDSVYVIFDGVYLAVSDNRAILQGARAEITNLQCDAYLNLIGSGSTTR